MVVERKASAPIDDFLSEQKINLPVSYDIVLRGEGSWSSASLVVSADVHS